MERRFGASAAQETDPSQETLSRNAFYAKESAALITPPSVKETGPPRIRLEGGCQSTVRGTIRVIEPRALVVPSLLLRLLQNDAYRAVRLCRRNWLFLDPRLLFLLAHLGHEYVKENPCID